ncbi:hypothetical protein CPLU01_14839 [Colletotrichum plurivorum]|uniref:Uncharacterized protein n=1 Tax=Colletotrichum plurivorum TaxID=2175906 RepID=A0A8H6JHJ0_9PEZI|nr:hypothetical protein CPLU01_14839 [Colletotrichum plurivorum]
MAAHRLEGLLFFTRAPRISPYQAHAYAPLASANTRHVLPRSLLDSHAIADNRKSRASRACGADRRLLFRTDCRPPIYPHLLGLVWVASCSCIDTTSSAEHRELLVPASRE